MKLKNENLNEPLKPQLNIAAVISSALPLSLCGEKPKVDKSYMPAEVEISCVNHNCPARPSVYESVQCVENKGVYCNLFTQCLNGIGKVYLISGNTRHCLITDSGLCDVWASKHKS
jgi:hypothetical protein